MKRVGVVSCLALIVMAGCLGADLEGDGLGEASWEDAGVSLDEVSMENARALEEQPDRVVFVWEDEVSMQGLASSELEIPMGVPFTLDIQLTWEGDKAPWFQVNDEETRICDASTPENDALTCTIPSLEQNTKGAWGILVGAEIVDGPDAISFTMHVEVRAEQHGLDTPALLEADQEETRHDPGWPSLEEASVRPGVKVGGQICTANFIFQSATNATLYIGTAAHCLAASASRPSGLTLGEAVPVASGAIEGTVAYCSWGASENLLSCPYQYGGENRADDFALIEISDEDRDKVHPAMKVWGGPTHVGTVPEEGTFVYTYGNTDMRDGGQNVNVVDSRPGVVTYTTEARTSAYFAPSSVWGDSGSPVIQEDGGTVGTLVSIGAFPPAAIEATNLDHSLENLEAHTGKTVELSTWALFDVPRADGFDPVPP